MLSKLDTAAFIVSGMESLRPRTRLLFTAVAASLARADVLVNTPGGSGSTLVMSLLRNAKVPINSPYNADGLKHRSARWPRRTLP